jgi:valyl-tRNA synthetase
MSEDTKELPTAYESKAIEPKWRKEWEEKQVFHADPDSKKPGYCIMIPPPNVTGSLHMGHALGDSVTDILIRWKKMTGFETLWMPGTDHAGIATQSVVERKLLQLHGKHRLDFSREEFLQHVWDWTNNSQSTITNQIRMIGCGCDWQRLRFSMDSQCNKAVRHMFKKLFDQGLIYRGKYLINWDPVTGTALADDEVEYEERQTFLWTIRYPLVSGNHALFVSTTRPETMLGDTAVAVHPHDERYKSFIGQKVLHPLTQREIPIVADEFVDMEFGTGVVKLTPAHDPCDYQVALRYNLPMINVLTKNGKINEEGGALEGLSPLEAREAIVSQLQQEGTLVRAEPYHHRVGVSYRSKAIIEPMLSEQWFVKLSAFKDVLRNYVVSGKLKLVPKAWESTYFQWIDNLRDWCISRQLWWGHRIPVWYRKDAPDVFICHDGDNLPPEVEKNPELYEQDPDVLDTWFSSALWPFSTLGWPDKTPELDKFYPNSTLITGHDILFFWVARMAMMGHVAFGDVPFHETFLHGLIYGKSYWRDRENGGITYVTPQERKEFDMSTSPLPPDVKSKWEKMSKSKGNVLDPIEIIDEYGADAMRLALASITTDANILELDRRRFEEFRHFVNKIWNGSRFIITNVATGENSLTQQQIGNETLASLDIEDQWIFSRLSTTIKTIEEYLASYAFDKATNAVYRFFWDEFCAYYIELAKPAFSKNAKPETRTRKQVVCLVLLIDIVRLFHPFAPFITEELFSILKDRFESKLPKTFASKRVEESLLLLHTPLLAQTPFPRASIEESRPECESRFEVIQRVVQAIRTIRGEMKIPPSTPTDLFILGNENSSTLSCCQEHEHLIRALVKIHNISFHAPKDLSLSSRIPCDDVEIIVPLPEAMKEQEKARIHKAAEKLRIACERTQEQLQRLAQNPNAPQHVREKLLLSLEQQSRELKMYEQQLTLLQ